MSKNSLKLSEGFQLLVEEELQDASLKHGEKFTSAHEGYSVLKEEVEEVDFEFKRLKKLLAEFWTYVKEDETQKQRDTLALMYTVASKLGEETVQVAAMINKNLTSL